MGGFENATPGVLVVMALMIGPVLYYIRVARRRKDLYVRRLAGVDAIDEAAGRSAELGRPLSFSTGLTNVSPVLYACLGVLYYVARKAAQYRLRLLVPQNTPEVMAIAEDVLREAYRAEGRSAQFDPRNVRFLSEEQFAFAAGYIGMVQRERVAGAFLFGNFAAESLILAEAGQQVGAMQVGASVSPEQVAFFIAACDYTLIGEELFAASAYLTREPVQLGSLYGQDRAKLVLLLMILVGVGIATLNSLWPELGLTNLGTLMHLGWGVGS
ncbi:MAG: hypothetical protein OXF11_09835 [Deltaproteobacteria bacterium]|nr:hypothetical protein [Deltaproteobacteria bacterium]